MTESESPLTESNFTCTKNMRCSANIFITQETGGIGSEFQSFKIPWGRQSVVS